jgi:general secretion pathway protein K
LQRLCEAAGVSPSVFTRILDGVQRSWLPRDGERRSRESGSLLAPERLSDLIWWGLTPGEIEQLSPWLILLPAATPLNINTASAEVMAVVIEGIDLSAAQRVDQMVALLPPTESPNRAAGLAVQSQFFELEGRLRLGTRVFEEQILVERRQLEVVVLHRERRVPWGP